MARFSFRNRKPEISERTLNFFLGLFSHYLDFAHAYTTKLIRTTMSETISKRRSKKQVSKKKIKTDNDDDDHQELIAQSSPDDVVKDTKKRKEPDAVSAQQAEEEEASKKRAHLNNSYFGNIDLSKAKVKADKYDNKVTYEVVQKDGKTLWCESPPMLLIYPKLHGPGNYPNDYAKTLDKAKLIAKLRDTTEDWTDEAIQALDAAGIDIDAEHSAFIENNENLRQLVGEFFWKNLSPAKHDQQIKGIRQMFEMAGQKIDDEKAEEVAKERFMNSVAGTVSKEKVKVTDEELEAAGGMQEGWEKADDGTILRSTGRFMFKFGKNAFRKLNDKERKAQKVLPPEEVQALSEYEQFEYRSNDPLKYSPLKIVHGTGARERVLNMDNSERHAWHGDIATLLYTVKPYVIPGGGDNPSDRYGVRVSPIKLRMIRKGPRKDVEGGSTFGVLEDDQDDF